MNMQNVRLAKFRNNKFNYLFEGINTTVLIVIAIVMIYPFWHELCISLSSPAQATRGGIFLIPRDFTLQAYQQTVKHTFIWSSFANSIITAVLTTVLGLIVTSGLAYGLSKSDLPGRSVFAFLILFCMIFNGGMIPTFVTVHSYGLIDTLWALVLLNMVTPYNTIIMMNYFRSLPEELEEAATVDGANPVTIFFKIIIPLSKAILATVSLWIAVASWNNFQGALLYLNSRQKFTLPLYTRQVIDGTLLARETGEGAQTAVESVIGATIVLTILPILMLYPFIQKYFVKGVMIGSVKG